MNSAANGDMFGFEPGIEEDSSSNAFQTLLDNVNSYHLDKRHLAVSCLAEALSVAEDSGEDRRRVLQTLQVFAEDPETLVRSVFMTQLTEITDRLREKLHFKEVLSDFIFPAFLKSSTDSDSEIRKSSHAGLVNFVKLQNLSQEEVNRLLIHITESVALIETEELRIEIVSLIADLSQVINRNDILTYLLSTFLNLCLDTAFSIRKACAMNFGKFCANVDEETFERDLLPKFSVLCQDSVWGVRKACAECFVDVAMLGPSNAQQELFVRLLLGLLNDVSRWVRVSAYQALGPFIATFASDDFNFASKIETTNALDKVEIPVDSNSALPGSVSSKTDDVSTKPDTVSDREINALTVLGIAEGTTDSTIIAADNVSALDAKTDVSEDNISCVNPENATATEGIDAVSESNIKALSDDGSCADDVGDDLTSCTTARVSVDTDLAPGEGFKDVDRQIAFNSGEEEEGAVDTKQMPRDVDSLMSERVLTAEDAMAAAAAAVNQPGLVDDRAVEPVERLGFVRSDEDDASPDKTYETHSNDDDDSVTAMSANDHMMTVSGSEDVSDESLAVSGLSAAEQEEGLHGDSEMAIGEIQENEGCLTPFAPGCVLEMENNALQSKVETGGSVSDGLDSSIEISTNMGACIQAENGGNGTHDDLNTDSAGDVSEEAAAVTVEGLDIINIDSSADAAVASENSSYTSIRTASVSELSEPEQEVVRNIGSVHVHVKDELNVVDGVVQSADNLVKINITHQDVITLQQEALDESNEEEKICRANVVHIPPESSSQQNSGRPFLMKKCPGSSRFGFPLVAQRMAYYDDDSDVETDLSPEKSSLESANRELAAVQSIVPCELLEQYLNMAEPSRAQSVDTDILKHCAFSLPAVAFTLGKNNWTCLQRLYRFLARNMQWQVRRTLALSIHKMALILGDDLTVSELLPVFDELIKDLDEVRSGIVKNLSEFLQLLPERIRICYLPKLENFLITDTNTRWRYRQDFAQQLISLVSLFSMKDVQQHILPIAFVLASDKVSEVRHSVMHLFSAIVKTLLERERSCLLEVLETVRCRLLESNVWRQRQLYISFGQSVLDDNSLSFPDFVKLLLPSIVSLREDPVPNVRITLGRFLSHVITTHSGSLERYGSLCERELQDTLETLKRDKDQDVRYFVDPMTSRLLSIV